MSQHRPAVNLQRAFPRDRKEAEKTAALVREQARAMGCSCRQVRVDFIDPPIGTPYIHVGHDVLCVLA